MADPAAAGNAAKAAGTRAIGALSTLATQAFHPKNWIRNAGIVALAAVFLPAAASLAAPGATVSVGSFLGAAKANAVAGLGNITAAAPDAAKMAAHGIGELVQMAQGIQFTPPVV